MLTNYSNLTAVIRFSIAYVDTHS